MVPNRLVVNVKDLLLFGLLILCIFTIYRNQQNNEKTQNSPKSWLNGQNRKIVIYNRVSFKFILAGKSNRLRNIRFRKQAQQL